MKYNVHVYTLARVFVPNVEAESMEKAIDWVCERTNFHTLIDSETWPDGSYAEWCEGDDYDSFLVDVVGDHEFEQSRTFDSEGREVSSGGAHEVVVRSLGANQTEVLFNNRVTHLFVNTKSLTALLKDLADLGRFWVREEK